MEWIANLFDASDFPPRWHCGVWSPALGWTHIVADIAIFSAYAAIPLALCYFVLRRRDVPFLPIFWLFAAFITSCGFGHLVEAVIFWHPWYRFSALVKVATAVVSWGTVFALWPVLPRALKLPGLAVVNRRLEESNQELRRFTAAVTDREDRVIELKREVNDLLAQLGRPQRYLQESAVGPV